MESLQQKRKHLNETELSIVNKKPHSEEDVTFSNIRADSTHIEEENESLIKTIVENLNGIIDEEEDDISSANTIVSSLLESSGINSALNEVIATLRAELDFKNEDLKNKEKETQSLQREVK